MILKYLMVFKIMLIYILPKICFYLLSNYLLNYISNFIYLFYSKNINFILIWKTQIKVYNKLNFIIKKNYLLVSNEKNLFKNLIYMKKNFNLIKKHNSFLLYTQKILKLNVIQKKTTNVNNFLFLHSYFSSYLNILKTNKHYLFGSLIWFFSWKFKKNSNLLALNEQLIVKKKKFFFKKNLKLLQKLNKKLKLTKNNYLFRKIFYTKYLFYNKYKINYYNLAYNIKFLKIKNNKQLNKIKNWSLSFFFKPYLFFHKKYNYNKIKKNWLFGFFSIYKKSIKKKKLKKTFFWLKYWFKGIKHEHVIYARNYKNFFTFNYLNFYFFNKNLTIFNNKIKNSDFFFYKNNKFKKIFWQKKNFLLLKQTNNHLLFHFSLVPTIEYKTLKNFKKFIINQNYLYFYIKNLKKCKKLRIKTIKCYKLKWNAILNIKSKVFDKITAKTLYDSIDIKSELNNINDTNITNTNITNTNITNTNITNTNITNTNDANINTKSKFKFNVIINTINNIEDNTESDFKIKTKPKTKPKIKLKFNVNFKHINVTKIHVKTDDRIKFKFRVINDVKINNKLKFKNSVAIDSNTEIDTEVENKFIAKKKFKVGSNIRTKVIAKGNIKKSKIYKHIYTLKNNLFFTLNNVFLFNIKFKSANNRLNFKYNLNQNYKKIKIIKNNIYNLFNRPIFKQKKLLNFLTNYNGFLYLSKKIITLKKNNIKTLINLRKNFYSFSSRYDIHKFILKAHFKSQFLNEYQIKKKNFKLTEMASMYLTNTKFNLNFNTNKETKANTSLMRFVQFQTNINKTTNQSVSFLETNYSNNDFISKKINGEIKIKRIKFKPGYIRIWKEARYVLKRVFNLNYRYEHRLTSFLNKQKRFIKLKLLIPFEMTLFNLITYSRFFCYKSFVTLFIENGMIFINGVPCPNPRFQIFVNDFIQLVVTIKYYIIYKFLLNYVIKKKLKLKKKINLRLNTSKKNPEKKKKHRIPDWILFETYHELDVPKYMELDFFTLSIFIIYEPFFIDDFNNLNLHTTKYNVLNLYNWKYIT